MQAVPDTISDGVEGRLVDADADALIDSLLDLAADRDAIAAMQAAARRSYARLYAPSVFAARVAELTEALDHLRSRTVLTVS